MHVQCTLTNFPTHQWVCVWSPWALSATVMPVSYFRSTTILYKCKSVADNLRALKCPIFPKVNEYLATLGLNTCPEFIGKKMNATFEYTGCMCITVSPVREVRALSQRDVGEGRFWVEGDAYKLWDHSQSEVWAGMRSEHTVQPAAQTIQSVFVICVGYRSIWWLWGGDKLSSVTQNEILKVLWLQLAKPISCLWIA